MISDVEDVMKKYDVALYETNGEKELVFQSWTGFGQKDVRIGVRNFLKKNVGSCAVIAPHMKDQSERKVGEWKSVTGKVWK